MSERIRSADKLLSMALDIPANKAALQANLTEALPRLVKEAKKETEPSFIPSNIYIIVVCALGLIGIIFIIGTIILASGTKEIPQALVAVGSAVIGGLVGVISQKSK